MSGSLEQLVEAQVSRQDLPEWASVLRRNSFAKFKTVGFPHRKQEAWKYTSTRRLVEDVFDKVDPSAVVKRESELASLENHENLQLIFMDGILLQRSNAFQESHDGLSIRSLSELLRAEPAAFAAVSDNEDPFALLNLASSEQGCVIELADHTELSKPIELIYLRSSADFKPMVNPRVQIRFGKFSKATILERFISHEGLDCFTNHAAEMVLSEAASCHHLRVMDEGNAARHMHNLDVFVGRDANFQSLAISLTTGWMRSNQNIRLQATGASATIDAIYTPSGSQHVDFCTVIDHQKPHTRSSQLYKGIVQKGARAIFNGKVLIAKGADNSQAFQLNRNLAFDEHCEIDTRPQMEIDADDVSCSHGATVGQLDADQLFYLQSRGIAPDAGRRLLAGAFVNEVLGKHADRLKQEDWRERILAVLSV